MSEIETKDSLEIISTNYTEFSKYTAEFRTYANIIDGCKSVQRRCIYGSSQLPRKLTKLTNHVGKIITMHPHSDSSIAGVLIGMTSKFTCPFPLYESQGNFGDRTNGASAPRYLESKLSDIAIKIFLPLIEFADYGSPEFENEPLALPTLLPLCLLHGTSGIGTGTPNPEIPSFDSVDLIKYYLKALKSDDFKVKNMMIKPNLMNTIISSSKKDWMRLIETGNAKIQLTANIQKIDDRTIIIDHIPNGITIDKLHKKLKSFIEQDKIDIRDESSDDLRFVVERVPRRTVNMDDVFKKCQLAMNTSESYKFIVTNNEGKVIYCSLNDIVRENLKYLIKCTERKFTSEIEKLKKQLSVLVLIEKIKTDGLVADFPKFDKDVLIRMISKNYEESEDTVNKVMQKSISYLTTSHNDELTELRKKLELSKHYLENPKEYLTNLYEELLPEIKEITKNRKYKTEFLEDIIK